MLQETKNWVGHQWMDLRDNEFYPLIIQTAKTVLVVQIWTNTNILKIIDECVEIYKFFKVAYLHWKCN